jgi:hypothetical protein
MALPSAQGCLTEQHSMRMYVQYLHISKCVRLCDMRQHDKLMKTKTTGPIGSWHASETVGVFYP